jgi:CBS domain-containing protein
MTKRVPHVDVSASVLDASKVMNQSPVGVKWTGVIVLQSGKPVGMLTERSLLRRFIDLNKKPEDVKVRDVMAPLLKISADAPVSEAAKKMLDHSFSRLAVFDGQKLVGWVTLMDIARQTSKQSIVEILLRQNRSTKDEEILCPICRSGIMEKVSDSRGHVLRWECPNCYHME